MADPLQLYLKIAIFLNFVREIPSPKTKTKITFMVFFHFFFMDFVPKSLFDVLGMWENCF